MTKVNVPVAVHHFVGDGDGGLLKIGFDGDDDGVAVRLRARRARGVIFDEFASIIFARVVAGAVHDESVNRACVFKHESIARETAARERKFQSGLSRCPRSVLRSGYSLVFALLADIRQIYVVHGRVVIDLA